MEQRITDLSVLIEATETNLRRFGYTKSSLKHFYSGWNKLRKFMAERGDPPYSPVIGLDFLNNEIGYPRFKHETRSKIIRSIRLLNDYQQNQTISGKISLSKTVWSADLEKLRESYANYCYDSGMASATVRSYLQAADPFLRVVVMDKGIELQDIEIQTVSEYIATLNEFTQSTIRTRLGGLRNFFRFLLKSGYVQVDLTQFIPRATAAKPERIPEILSNEDIKKLLAAVDRSSPIGKRDYAVLIIAALLGLRNSDIITLTFDNFHWDACRIELIQQKTGEPVYLPLLPAVGDAVIDYLKNGRPETTCKNVFVKHCAPYDPVTSFYDTMEKHMRIAGIRLPHTPLRGLHILRHTLASGLVMQGEAYNTVSAVLGHTNGGSLDAYAHIDVEGLLQCALDPWEVGFCGKA